MDYPNGIPAWAACLHIALRLVFGLSFIAIGLILLSAALDLALMRSRIFVYYGRLGPDAPGQDGGRTYLD